MHKINFKKSICILICILSLCQPCFLQQLKEISGRTKTGNDIKTGADQTEKYLPLILNKRVAIVSNQTGIICKINLVDTLLKRKVNIKKIFCPEHGFRGNADAGEELKNYKDKKTGLPIVSLYGKNNKPTPADLNDIDVIVFDLQDVGVRFYTYISTLHYVMEACAENKKQLIVLDRPNPNGYYIDGPVLEEKFKSFVGLHPVPIVYGMTIGEYAQMINGEGWLQRNIKCDLTIIKLQGYGHKDLYELPVKPSPNLPNMTAVYLYPSLALFEGTGISVGRGTPTPFQVIGHPTLKEAPYTFTPKNTTGASNPMYNGQECHGYSLKEYGDMIIKNSGQLYLFWLEGTYKSIADKETYFNNYFNSLAGNATLKQQIIDNVSEEEIRKTWESGIKKFKVIRKKYLIYEDFE